MGLFDWLFGKKQDVPAASPVSNPTPSPKPVADSEPVTPEAPIINKHWGTAPDDVDKPAWRLILINPNGIRVTYQEKYGSLITKECIGLWQNDTEYMLTWKTPDKIFLQKSNINTIEATPI